jgi:hypothetical protein
MIKDDNIRVFKDNNIYQIVYNPPNGIKLENIKFNDKWINMSDLNNYIIDNEIDINYQDIENGNTIYHEILSEHNCDNIKKLLEKNNIDYNVKNYYDKTPIECINNIKIATIVINDLNKKLDKFEEKLNILENKCNILNCTIFDFIKIKLYDLIIKNSDFLFYTSILLIFYSIIFIYFF